MHGNANSGNVQNVFRAPVRRELLISLGFTKRIIGEVASHYEFVRAADRNLPATLIGFD